MFDIEMLSKLPLDTLMEMMEKYKNVDVTKVKLTIEKYDNALILKIVSDSDQVGNIFTDLFPLLLNGLPKENLEIIDKTG